MAAAALIGSLAAPGANAAADANALRPHSLAAYAQCGGVRLSWQAPDADAASVTGYRVLRRVPGTDAVGTFHTIASDTATTTTTYLDAGAATPGQAYTYRVKALRASQASKQSRYVRIDIDPAGLPPCPTPPNTPDEPDGTDGPGSDGTDDNDGSGSDRHRRQRQDLAATTHPTTTTGSGSDDPDGNDGPDSDDPDGSGGGNPDSDEGAPAGAVAKGATLTLPGVGTSGSPCQQNSNPDDAPLGSIYDGFDLHADNANASSLCERRDHAVGAGRNRPKVVRVSPGRRPRHRCRRVRHPRHGQRHRDSRRSPVIPRASRSTTGSGIRPTPPTTSSTNTTTPTGNLINGKEFSLFAVPIDGDSTIAIGQPTGLWTDGAHMWMSDGSLHVIRVFHLVDDPATDATETFGTYATGLEMSVTGVGRSLAADGHTLWHGPLTTSSLLAYHQQGPDYGERRSERDIDLGSEMRLRGLWSDGTTMFAVDDAETGTDKIVTVRYRDNAGGLAVSGLRVVGATLTADLSGLTDPNGLPDDTAFGYQWRRNGDRIPGATEPSYTLADADEGKLIWLDLKYVDNAGYSEFITVYAAGQVVVPDPDTAPFGPSYAGFDLVAGNTAPSSLVIHGATLWVLDEVDVKAYAYKLADDPDTEADEYGARDSAKDMSFSSPNVKPLSFTIHDDVLWVSDEGTTPAKVFAYDFSGGTKGDRITDKDFTATSTAIPRGTWTDGRTMWVAQGNVGHAYAYRLFDDPDTAEDEYGTRDSSLDLDGVVAMWGVWSDGTTAWVNLIDSNLRHTIEAYRMSDRTRRSARDIAFGGHSIDVVGLWSDGTTMFALKSRGTTEISEVITFRYRDNAGGLAIGGDVSPGGTLTADLSGLSDGNGLARSGGELDVDALDATYMWLRDGVPIVGATGSSYTLAADDLGEVISLRMSFTDAAGYSETVRASAVVTLPVADPPEAAAAGAPHVSAGGYHSCWLKSNADIKCRGYGRFGQTAVPELGDGESWSLVSAGEHHTCAAIATAGTTTDVRCWGWGYAHDRSKFTNERDYLGGAAANAALADGRAYVGLDSGAWHSCVLVSDGTISCWGRNDDGQTTVPDLGSLGSDSDPWDSALGWTQVSAGGSGTGYPEHDRRNSDAASSGFTCAIAAHPDWATAVSPTGADGDAAVAAADRGRLACWGYSGGFAVTAVPELGPGRWWTQVSAGGAHACALTSDGQLWCWGNNGNHQLQSPNSTPTPNSARAHLRFNRDVHISPHATNNTPWTAVTAAKYHTCATFDHQGKGQLACWDTDEPNDHEAHDIELGANPGRYLAARDAALPSAGNFHTCWLHHNTSSGTGQNRVTCYGDNSLNAADFGTNTNGTPY